jgi:hypothetical protein
MGKEENFKGNGKNTRFPHNDPTKGGRKPSIKTQLKDIMSSDGNLTMNSNQVVKINKDGSVVIKVPTQMQLAMKLMSWAMSKRGGDSIKAIQMIMEQIDGKPKQEVEQKVEILEQPLFPDLS